MAAVAASVLIHTAGILQQKATATGTTTINQVSSGITITQIMGYDPSHPAEQGGVSLMAIFVTNNAGGSAINLGNASVTLTVDGVTAILVYNDSIYNNSAINGTQNLFSEKQWSYLSASHHDATDFGVIVVQDPTNSIDSQYPVISPGDTAAIILNVSNTFGAEITQNMQVSGQVTPEVGAQAIIQFTAPNAFVTNEVTLQ